MTNKDIARLSCKLLSIYTLISAIKSLNYFVVLPFQEYGTGMFNIMIVLTAIPSTFLFASGIILWVYADKLVKHLVPDKELAAGDPRRGLEDIQGVAFSVVGILILSDAAPKLMQVLLSIVLLLKLQYAIPNEWLNVTTITRSTGLVIQLIIGFWLFLGSRGIVGLLRKLREAGLKPSNNEDSQK